MTNDDISCFFFYNHGSREEVLEMAGLSPSHIKKAVKECCN